MALCQYVESNNAYYYERVIAVIIVPPPGLAQMTPVGLEPPNLAAEDQRLIH